MSFSLNRINRLGTLAIAAASMPLLSLLTILTVSPAHAAITGTVFQDFNANGVMDTTTVVANDTGGG